MADDIVTRLQCIYDEDGCAQCTFCLARAEIDRLRRWKAEATEVLKQWDTVADMVPARLGDLKSDAVAVEIERLRTENAKQKAEIIRLESQLRSARRGVRRG